MQYDLLHAAEYYQGNVKILGRLHCTNLSASCQPNLIDARNLKITYVCDSWQNWHESAAVISYAHLLWYLHEEIMEKDGEDWIHEEFEKSSKYTMLRAQNHVTARLVSKAFHQRVRRKVSLHSGPETFNKAFPKTVECSVGIERTILEYMRKRSKWESVPHCLQCFKI